LRNKRKLENRFKEGNGRNGLERNEKRKGQMKKYLSSRPGEIYMKKQRGIR